MTNISILVTKIQICLMAIASITIGIISLSRKDHTENATIIDAGGNTVLMRDWIKDQEGISNLNTYFNNNAPPQYAKNLDSVQDDAISYPNKATLTFESGEPTLTYFLGNDTSFDGQPYGQSCRDTCEEETRDYYNRCCNLYWVNSSSSVSNMRISKLLD